jgi:hypothetical protein
MSRQSEEILLVSLLSLAMPSLATLQSLELSWTWPKLHAADWRRVHHRQTFLRRTCRLQLVTLTMGVADCPNRIP